MPLTCQNCNVSNYVFSSDKYHCLACGYEIIENDNLKYLVLYDSKHEKFDTEEEVSKFIFNNISEEYYTNIDKLNELFKIFKIKDCDHYIHHTYIKKLVRIYSAPPVTLKIRA